tara:strand:+ start:8204 stop:8569 length:366 start_codon:yes stop_codon:yes gene_type:complete
MAKRNTWTRDENLALISYALVLDFALRRDLKVNKRECIRQLQSDVLSARTRGSIEAKMMNLSHAAVQCGDEAIPGYKAAGNFQRCLIQMWENRNDEYDIEAFAKLAVTLKPRKQTQRKVAA